MMDTIYDEAKYVSLCAHDFQKSLTNEIELPCKLKPGTVHKISQYGKICNKCTHIIKDSYQLLDSCLVCTDELEEYVKDRQLCQHEQREYFEVVIKCLNTPNKTHEVPFATKICKRCNDKLRATFMNSKTCKVCDGKEEEVIRNMQKTFISSAYSHFKNVISILRQAKAPDQVYKNQIESACKAYPKVTRISNNQVQDQLIEDFNADDLADNHESKRYKLYPKCRKHKEVQLQVCNMCLVALLNLQGCPFGCVLQEKVQKVKVDRQTKTYQTGFLFLYPQKTAQSNHLQLFIIKLIEQRGRMDRWQCKIHKIYPQSNLQIKFIQNFPLFYSAVALTDRQFIVCGGAIGPHIANMKTTNQAFVVSISQNLKQYSIIDIPPMREARSGHALVYHQVRKMVFAIGGIAADGSIANSTQVYSIQKRQWFKLKDLNVERTRPTAFVYQDNVYVMGGQTRNQKIYEAQCQKFNLQIAEWQKFTYDGFDYPFITDSAATTSLIPLQNKNSLYLFGGSNTGDICNYVQPVAFDAEKKQFKLNHQKIFTQMIYPRFGATLGFIKEDAIICFGGLEEHQNLFTTIEGFNLKITDKEVSVFSKLDDVTIGSYRLMLREDAKVTYKRLYNLLEEQGLIDETKMSNLEDKNLAESHNYHLIQRLWFTVGKSFVWMPL